MLLLRLSQGISSGCQHATLTTIFLPLPLLWGGGIMLLLRLIQGIFSGWHHATTTIFFGIVIVGKGNYASVWLSQVFLQGATIPKLHPKLFSELSVWFKGISFLLRLGKGISSGCTMAPLRQKNLISHCGKGTLCCSFDLAKVFLQGATMPPPHHFFKLSLAWERGIMLQLRVIQDIFQGATMLPYTKKFLFFGNCH